MPALRSRWACPPYCLRTADRLAEELGISPVTAAVLVRRGHASPETARAFLAGADRHDPATLPGAAAATASILGHVRRGSRIVVHGDYDVDGVCSTAILLNTLRRLGVDADWHLPSRSDDGYGLSAAAVARHAGRGAELLITVDCAITAVDEVEEAGGLGLDVVVTDHHRVGARLPACPVVHPALGTYGTPELCAAGVVHKLSESLLAAAGLDPALAAEDLDLVALATVADLVPLRGENRRLVREGLSALARTSKPGLRALMRVAALEPAAVDEGAVGFRLAPRLNAPGRLRRADAALELLTTRDPERAGEIADELDELNRERRDAETRILFAAEAAAREAAADAPALVLAGEGWHPGVIGIVASRIVERYHRPTVLIALGADGGRGSGRSISAYDLHAGLSACAAHLTRFGGHAMAAGLEILPERVDAFRAALVAHAGSALSPEDLVPEERVDALVPGDRLGMALAEELQDLAPFGMGNPRPALLVPAARIEDVRGLGAENQHSAFTLRTAGARARGVAFRTGRESLPKEPGAQHDVVVRLEVDEWNGRVEPRLVLRAVCAPEPGRCVDVGEEDFWTAFRRHRGEERSSLARLPGALDGPRRIRDRRGEGLAGLAGDLLSSGDPVLVVSADPGRRRRGLERVVAGAARGGGPLPLVSWEALAARPGLAEPFDHLFALDPPPGPEGETLLAAAPAPPRGGLAILGWGAPEIAFAGAVAERAYDLDDSLRNLYRSLRERGGAGGSELRELLEREGPASRPPELAARLVAVLEELELAVLEEAGAELRLRLLPAQRTSLDASASYREARRRLDAARRYFGGAAAPTRERGPSAAPAPAAAAR